MKLANDLHWVRFCVVLAVSGLVFGTRLSAQQPKTTDWTEGVGKWTDAARWSGGLPTEFQEATVRGDASVVIPLGSFLAGRLNVGTHSGDHSKVELDGGHLLIRQNSLIVGEETGGEGALTLSGGTLESVMDVFVGGATGSTGRMNKSLLLVRGGTLVGLTLTVGEGLGSESTFAVVGSRATAISALEFVRLLGTSDPSGKPGITTLSFTLDEHGVTPIVIPSRWHGLQIEHDSTSHCNLRIALNAVPPRDDVTLVTAKVPNEGAFDGLPEGSNISAQYGGHTYKWTLTYEGGPSGHDLVLHNVSTYAPNAPMTYARPIPAVPTPSWWGHPVYPLAVAAGRPAFPGAEGYGAYTRGGLGGRQLFVDNLNDSGRGSLRAAIETKGPRTVTFRVGGTIALKSTLIIADPYLTLDGSNAPAPGIMLRRHGIEVHTHDVVLRQFRIRIGDEDVHRDDKNILYAAGDGEYALYFTDGARDSIADHLSLSWSTNKILSTTGGADRITIQWCILSEALNLDGHGYASIAGGNRVTWHHNLFAHDYSRNVRFQGAVDADFRNNVVYDWGEKSAYGEFDRVNYIGNYLKPGVSTLQKRTLFMDGTESVAPRSLYLAGNILEGNQNATADNWRGTGFYFDRDIVAAAEPFPAPPVTTELAADAYEHVLAAAGATSPVRDAVDARVVKETRTGTGRIVESVDQAGGWPAF